MDESQRQTLLTLARKPLEAHLAGKPLPEIPAIETDAANFGGAFVTLKNKGRLRGCIGQFLPKTSLTETVQEMTLSSLQDPRFQSNPVTDNELPEITIEISVLSPMNRTDDPLSLELGVHGIYIRKAPRAGCFLPQVATEQRWTTEQFLSHCCAGKAGLLPDAWKDPDTEVHLFTAEVFGEQR